MQKVFVKFTMQSIKKSEEGQELTPTDERANGTERVLWNEKETGKAGAVALIKKKSMETQKKPYVVPEAPQQCIGKVISSGYKNYTQFILLIKENPRKWCE